MKLNETIRENRNRLGLTQDAIAKKLNVTRQTVSKWEQGINEPDVDTIKKLAAIFSISIDELLSSGISHKQSGFAISNKVLFLVNTGLFLLNLATIFVYLRFLEDLIPAHYNFKFEVDRYGSKYETLLFIPVYTCYYALAIFGYYIMKKGCQREKQICGLILHIFAIIIQMAFGVFVAVLNSKYLQVNTSLNLLLSLGSFFVFILAIFMHPKINSNQNSVFGIRTNLTLKNKGAWNKVNQFGSICIGLFALLQFLLFLFLPRQKFLLLYGFGVLIALIPIFIYHHLVNKRINKEEIQ